MSEKIQRIYQVSNTSEVGINYNGSHYLIIYGKHINGWFIASPNWQFCVEAAHPDDDFYNTEKLSMVIKDVETACFIAKAIKDHFNEL